MERPDRGLHAAELFTAELSVPSLSLVECAHAGDLPAIRWRLHNVEQFKRARPEAFERQVSALEEVLG